MFLILLGLSSTIESMNDDDTDILELMQMAKSKYGYFFPRDFPYALSRGFICLL